MPASPSPKSAAAGCSPWARSARCKTAEHASLADRLGGIRRLGGTPLPSAAAIAVAGPVQGELLKLTNNPWMIRPALIPDKLGVEPYTLVNDFGAVAHAVAQLGDAHFAILRAGPAPARGGMISVVGPGTGLGVAQSPPRAAATMSSRRRAAMSISRRWTGSRTDPPPVAPAPSPGVGRAGRSGLGLANIYEALAAIEGRDVRFLDEKALWQAAWRRGQPRRRRRSTASACRWALSPATSPWRRARRRW